MGGSVADQADRSQTTARRPETGYPRQAGQKTSAVVTPPYKRSQSSRSLFVKTGENDEQVFHSHKDGLSNPTCRDGHTPRGIGGASESESWHTQSRQLHINRQCLFPNPLWTNERRVAKKSTHFPFQSNSAPLIAGGARKRASFQSFRKSVVVVISTSRSETPVPLTCSIKRPCTCDVPSCS